MNTLRVYLTQIRKYMLDLMPSLHIAGIKNPKRLKYVHVRDVRYGRMYTPRHVCSPVSNAQNLRPYPRQRFNVTWRISLPNFAFRVQMQYFRLTRQSRYTPCARARVYVCACTCRPSTSLPAASNIWKKVKSDLRIFTLHSIYFPAAASTPHLGLSRVCNIIALFSSGRYSSFNAKYLIESVAVCEYLFLYFLFCFITKRWKLYPFHFA